ncbi:hypothetical protein T484DRAFT_1849256 [Baffinella frigidus]|nr:hypothetical protein T484DRAFT_1849256 [Cryptophyta sp. CCMP2293]
MVPFTASSGASVGSDSISIPKHLSGAAGRRHFAGRARRAAWREAQRFLASVGSDSISIPEHLWAVVIGAKGARIRGFEDKCGARLQMEREPVPRCLVQGTPDQRRVAMQLIREVMEVRGEEDVEV